MSLLDLPTEVLSTIPLYIRNIEDHMNFGSSCRTLHAVTRDTNPKTILRLAAASAPTFFKPHPYFLVMSTARQLSDWAIGNQDRTTKLRQAFQGGIEALYDLCLEHCELTMVDIRQLHLERFSTINTLADQIDKMAGSQWYAASDFWNGGVSEPETLRTEPFLATFQYIIYGELFASTMRAWLEPDLQLPRFDLQTRLDYFKCCVPEVDWEYLAPGPRRDDRDLSYLQSRPPFENQSALRHITNCRRWRRMWEKVTVQIGPDFEQEWRQSLWWNALQTLGLDGARIVIQASDNKPLSEECIRRLTRIRQQVEALDGQRNIPPCGAIIKGHSVSEAPNFRLEALASSY